MMKTTDVTVREITTEEQRQNVKTMIEDGTGGSERFVWFPVGKTLAQWHRSRDGGVVWVTHQGTLMRTQRGVFAAGMIGSIYVGQKNEDGSIRRDLQLHMPPVGAYIDETGHQRPFKEIVIEAADPKYGGGCRRMPDGSIHCECEDF